MHTSYNPFTRPDWTKAVKEFHDIERAKPRLWMSEGRPRGMNYSSYREYKRAKRLFRNVLDREHAAYMSKVYADIDKAAEVDLRLFWKLTKHIKPKTSRLYPKITDSTGKKNTDAEWVAEAFADHYETLYSCLMNQHFDDGTKKSIDTKISKITELFKGDLRTLPGGPITSDEKMCFVQSLRSRKAPGVDRITNEHIKYGGETLTLCIAVMFNAIIDSGKIPTEWKQGLIIPIHKGAGKPKDSCKSYRPVALLPCIFKIFEKIILSRINSQILQHSKFPNPQQQSFKKISAA